MENFRVGSPQEREKPLGVQKPAAAKYANLIYSDFCASSADQLGLEPIDMGYGDPASNKFIPEHLRTLLVDALHEKNAGAYPDVAGEKDLIETFKKYIQADEHLEREYHLAIVSGGGRSALTNIFRMFIEPKDIILIPYPAWSGYKALAAFVDGVIFPVRTTMENRFIPSGEDVKSAIDQAREAHPESKIKLAVLNTPHNPTGTVYLEHHVREILQVFQENGIVCVADYTYRAIRNEQADAVSIHKTAEKMEEKEKVPSGTYTDRIVAMQTLGKVSLTPGLRLGYVATTNESLIKNFSAKKQATDFSGSLFVQKALARYLLTENQKEEFKDTVEFFEERRDALLKHLEKCGYSSERKNIVVNSSGFYVSFEVPRRFQRDCSLSEFDKLMARYPFVGQTMGLKEYKAYFEAKGRFPSSELFVLELIKETAVNVLPGRLFCPSRAADEEPYENWVRLALIHDVEAIDEAFARIEKCESILAY